MDTSFQTPSACGAISSAAESPPTWTKSAALSVMSSPPSVAVSSMRSPLLLSLPPSAHRRPKAIKPTLKRVLMRTREIMDLAVCAGYIQHNPIDRVSRVFAAPIVKPMPAPPWRELPLVMETMKDAPARMRVLFLFSLCSMLRPGENAKLRKSWIEADVLTIPAVEMKKRSRSSRADHGFHANAH